MVRSSGAVGGLVSPSLPRHRSEVDTDQDLAHTPYPGRWTRGSNQMRFYDGTGSNEYNADELKSLFNFAET